MHDSRIAFADTNWLVAIYHPNESSAAVRRWNETHPGSTLIVSEAVLAESRCSFWRVGNRFAALESDLRRGLFQDCGFKFAEMSADAAPMFQRYAPRCNVGTLDLLHIAAARRFGCRWFLSFDTNSGCRAVAHAENLKVFPELNATDRRWLAKFK